MTREQIKALRTEMGLGQVDFAARVGVTVTQISRWETGRFKPSPLAVEKLKALQIPAATSSSKTRKLQKAG